MVYGVGVICWLTIFLLPIVPAVTRAELCNALAGAGLMLLGYETSGEFWNALAGAGTAVSQVMRHLENFGMR